MRIDEKYFAELNVDLIRLRDEIDRAKQGYARLWAEGDERRIFAELTFCILTPQSGAFVCWDAVKRLLAHDLLFTGGYEEIREAVFPVRFFNNKSKYIIEARDFFVSDGSMRIRETLSGIGTVSEKRAFLIRNVKGIGWKESSHFLRNVGFGEDLAILDRHILKNLVRLGVIGAVPSSVTGADYVEIEGLMRGFCSSREISMADLDLLLWQRETGRVFK